MHNLYHKIKIIFLVWYAYFGNCLSVESRSHIRYVDKDETKLYIRAKHSAYEEALASFNQLVMLNPKDYIGERARFFAQRGATDLALRDFNEAVKLDPDIWLAVRAHFYEDVDCKNAEHDYSTLIELRKSIVEDLSAKLQKPIRVFALADSYCKRSLFYERRKEIDKALADLQIAAELSPTYIRVLADFAEKKNYPGVYLNTLDKLIALDEQRYLLRRAKFYEKTDKLSSAEADFNYAVIHFKKVGKDDGYSPRAWALLQRANFFDRTNRPALANGDRIHAKAYEKMQQSWGFSGWPRD